MWPQFLYGFANTLVVSYAADGWISLLDIVVENTALTSLRGVLATFVVLQSMLAIPLLGMTRRLPISVFLPVVASALWFAFGATPLVFETLSETLERSLVLAQLAIACFAFFRIRSLRGGQGWLFDADWFSGRLFSFPYFVGYGVSACLVLFVSLVVLTLASFTRGLESATKGFVRFDSQGISLADRRYENAGRRIRLVGMMHIGEEEGYRSLFQDLGRASSSTLVLTEGVSDSEGMLSGGFSFAPLADFLGLEEQRAIEDYVERVAGEGELDPIGPTFRNADLDVSDFDPRTIQWLGEVTEIYRGGDVISRLFEVYREMQRNPEVAAIVFEDIVSSRNSHLIANIMDFRSDYEEIVVPWGALHLPGIETAVEEMGFVRSSAAYVLLISWRRLGDALLAGAPRAATISPSDPD